MLDVVTLPNSVMCWSDKPVRLVPSPIKLRASTFPSATIPVVAFVNRIVFDVVFPLSMTPSRFNLGNVGALPPRTVSILPTRLVKAV